MSDLVELKCGDSHTVTVRAMTPSSPGVPGVPVDLSGCRVSWTMRSSGTMGSTSDDDATIAKVTTLPADANTNEVVWELSPAETRVRPGVYRHDVQIVRDGRVTSSYTREVEFVQDVTKDIA